MKAGVIVESLGPSQKAIQTTREINKIYSLEEYWDVIVFYMEYDRMIVSPKFAIMDVFEAYGMDSPIISTSIETTKIAINCLKATKRFFYVWDLEWTFKTYNVEDIIKVYMNPKVELIARSSEHFNILKSCWKEPIAIIENFNHAKLTDLISK